VRLADAAAGERFGGHGASLPAARGETRSKR
jgi:hypothetical protein